MKLEEQVCSLDLAKKLKELGVKQESAFYWVVMRDGEQTELQFLRKGPWESMSWDFFAAFTVAELFELLPHSINKTDDSVLQFNRMPGVNFWWFMRYGVEGHAVSDKSLTDTCAKMLIYLIEKGVVMG